MKIKNKETEIPYKVYGTQIYNDDTLFLIFVNDEFVWVDANNFVPYEE